MTSVPRPPPSGAPRIDIVVGTRPEAIKMAPVVRALVDARAGAADGAGNDAGNGAAGGAAPAFDARLVCTGQHREMVHEVLALFDLVPDIDLDVMGSAGGLSGTCAAMLAGLGTRFAQEAPDAVLVHGDTSSTLAGALAGFHARVPVVHVEAGLRTGDLAAPWPEEGNRKLVAAIAARHHAPTDRAREALLGEGVDARDIVVTGNTVVDALMATVARLEADPALAARARAEAGLDGLDGPDGRGDAAGRRLVLVTGHRRENHGRGVEDICRALARLAARGDVDIVYPVHPNPAIGGPVRAALAGVAHVHLVEPQGYLCFVELMRRSHLVITDSGGIQEEAPALGVPVLVMRDTTERPEAVAAGTVRLVGTDPDTIVAEAARLLDEPAHHRAMSRAHNPYGDGTAAVRIAADLAAWLRSRAPAPPPTPTPEDPTARAPHEPPMSESPYRTIGMIGLGYIGLPTAALLASRGMQVIGVDTNERAVATINAGSVHIVEPDLDIVVRATVTTGNLRATTVPEPCDAFLVAVPTPFFEQGGDAHVPDLSYIESAAKAIAPVLARGNLVVLESTSPVGTTEKLSGWLAAARPDLSFPHQAGEASDVRVAHCPERVLPGQVLQELVANDRVIGGLTPACAEAARQLYACFVKGECLVTTARTAELCKLTENAYRDVNIAFANEMSLVCESLDVSPWELIRLANRHPRVSILQPGPGVGGHCIAVDPWFIVHSAPEAARLIRTAREVNDHKPVHVVERVRARAARFREPTVACFGLAFKADIDDLRESPACRIVEALAQAGVGRLLVVEPHVKALPVQLSGRDEVVLVDQGTALAEADIVVGLVDHRAFRRIPAEALGEKIVIDTRGMWR